jgi:2-polyprenyl-3-methyl-5-hydroxy-6-metoxy-1,4-benzoquinol methylase
MLENKNNQSVCGYCKGIESEVQYKTFDIFDNHFTINKCKSCNAYFLAPRPTPEQIAQAYDSSYYGEKEEKFSSPLVEKTLDYFRSGRARNVSKFLNTGAKVLDVGCGNGRFLKYLLKFGSFELYGTEMEGNSAKRASRVKEITLKTGTLNAGDFPDNFFDAVSLFHVFEHLAEPKETLETISKIVKPGGIAVFSFPNIASFQARFFKGKWLHLDPPRHLFFFDPKDFIKIMESKGFKTVKQHYFSFEQNPFGAVQSFLNLTTKKREVLFESMKGNKDYIKEYSKFNLLIQKLFFLFSMPFFAFSDIFSSLLNKSATVEITFIKKLPL